jgi:hypothetical protein
MWYTVKNAFWKFHGLKNGIFEGRDDIPKRVNFILKS